MLAEIAFGAPVEERHNTNDVHVQPGTARPNGLEYVSVVSDWLSDAGEELLTVAYRRAVTFCLQQAIDGSVRLADEHFRGMVIENVLAPLQGELRIARRTPKLSPERSGI